MSKLKEVKIRKLELKNITPSVNNKEFWLKMGNQPPLLTDEKFITIKNNKIIKNKQK